MAAGGETQFERDVSDEKKNHRCARGKDIQAIANNVYWKLVFLKARSGKSIVIPCSQLYAHGWDGFTYDRYYTDQESCNQIVDTVGRMTSYQYTCTVRGFGVFASNMPILGRYLVCQEQ